MSFSDLPNVRDTSGEYPCQDACVCARAKAEELKKDRRLENWEKWAAVHKKLNDNLSENLLRGPCRTLIHSGNDLRTIKEEKAILEYTRIPNPHDKYRGNPAFWKTPLALPALCNPKCPSDYLKVMTKEENCEIPEIEYVAVPDYIKAEMGYHCWGIKETRTRWNALEYRQHRVNALQNEISHIEPYKPDLNNLYIEGKAFIKKELWRDSIAEIKLRLSVQSERTDEAPAAEYYVQVNHIKITAASTSTNKIFIIFNYDVDSKKVATEYLKVNNATPLALRYHFERCAKHSIFTDIIPEVNPSKVFFFNMNEEIIPPHNAVDIPIWFKTNKDGIYKESWKFVTQPAVWTNDLIIIFEGMALSGSLEEKCAAIKHHLHEKAVKRIATRTIDEALSEIPRPQGEPILYTYDRAMVFEAVNQTYDPFTRRPKYLYNRPVVDQLEEFYARVKLPSHPDRWNYNIEDLRSVTKQRECYNYEQKMLLEIEGVKQKELEKSRQEPKKEDDAFDDKKEGAKGKGSKKKKGGEKEKVGKQEEAKDETLVVKEQGTNTTAAERPLCAQLEDIIMKLEQPSVWINLDRNKYEWTYQILCGCIDKICEEMDELNDTYFIEHAFKYPKLREQTNVVPAVEFLGDALTPGPFHILGSERVSPECLKDIPMEDTMKRYKTYYGIPDDQEGKKGGKKKGKKGKEKKKTKNEKAKGGKRKKGKEKESVKGTKASSAKVQYKINEDFDPYREIEIPSTPEPESSSSEGSREFYLQPGALEEYNERSYFIFYTNLESAIMRVFDVLENHNNKQIKLNVFKTVLESNKRLSKPVKFKAMDLKQAINESFELQDKLASPPVTETKSQQFGINEAIDRKEEGSLWSILRAPKQPEIQEKSISYPEEQVIIKKRYTKQHAFDEVGTVMSNAGIDPFWEDFKNVQTQTDEEEEPPEDDNVEKHVRSEIEKVMLEVFREVEEEVKCPEICKCDEGSSDEDSFYDNELPKV